MGTGTFLDLPRGRPLQLVDPDDLVLVDDPAHPLWTPHVHFEPNERTVLVMMEHGCNDPVDIVASEDRRPLVVDGRLRTINMREANRRLRKDGREPWKLLAITAGPMRIETRGTKAVYAHDSADAVRLMHVHNEHRHVDDPATRAIHIRRARDAGGFGVDQLAVMFDKSDQTIRDSLKVAERFSPEQLVLVSEGRLAWRDAIEAGRIDDKVARDAFIRERVAGTTPASETGNGRPRRPKDYDWERVRPTRRALQFICEKMAAQKKKLSDDAFNLLQWLAGGIETKAACDNVPGLERALRALVKEQKESEGEADDDA